MWVTIAANGRWLSRYGQTTTTVVFLLCHAIPFHVLVPTRERYGYLSY